MYSFNGVGNKLLLSYRGFLSVRLGSHTSLWKDYKIDKLLQLLLLLIITVVLIFMEKHGYIYLLTLNGLQI